MKENKNRKGSNAEREDRRREEKGRERACAQRTDREEGKKKGRVEGRKGEREKGRGKGVREGGKDMETRKDHSFSVVFTLGHMPSFALRKLAIRFPITIFPI